MSNRYERISRTVPLIDLDVGKDGRTVTAYAATFDDPYEVNDKHGRYVESINRTAFNRTLGRGIARVVPLFNHGLTIYGTPSERDSDPLGVAVDIRAEQRGLLTVTRFGSTPRAEEVLTMIKDGSVTSYSFQGTLYRSAPARPHASGLPLVERLELGLDDYGPGVFPVNRNAAVLAVRSTALIAEQIQQLTPEERAELLDQISPRPDADASLARENTDPHSVPAEHAPDDGLSDIELIELLEAEAAQMRRRLGL